MTVTRPIPQWFRLKTDTKIQVRNTLSSIQCWFTTVSNSTTLNADTGEGPSSTSRGLHQLLTFDLVFEAGEGLSEKRKRSHLQQKQSQTGDPLFNHAPTPCIGAHVLTFGTSIPTWFILKLLTFVFMEKCIVGYRCGHHWEGNWALRVFWHCAAYHVFQSFRMTIGRAIDLCS